MILKVAYTSNDIDFLNRVKELVSQYESLKIETYCRDHYNAQKNYYKLMSYYATRADKFMVLMDNNSKVIQPFYVENNTCTLDYLKITLDHWILYNPIEDGSEGNQETT